MPPDELWMCCECGCGPMMFSLHLACINYGHHRDSCCLKVGKAEGIGGNQVGGVRGTFDNQEVRIRCAWEIPRVLEKVEDKEAYLRNTLTLTAKVSSVEAATCQAYMQKVYGEKGLRLLLNIIHALASPSGIFSA